MGDGAQFPAAIPRSSGQTSTQKGMDPPMILYSTGDESQNENHQNELENQWKTPKSHKGVGSRLTFCDPDWTRAMQLTDTRTYTCSSHLTSHLTSHLASHIKNRRRDDHEVWDH